jgi:membrane fusion protein, multidrug efflux system
MTTKRMILMLILTGLVFGAVFGMKWFGTKMMNEFVNNMPTPPATISSAKAEPMQWAREIDAIGTLTAVNGADVTTEIGGIVTALHFESGARVERGAPLLSLDADTERAELAQLRAQAELAELTRQRREKLLALEAISKSDYDAAAAEAAAARAAVAAQAARLAQKEIRAPFAGQLGIRRVAVGQFLSPGTAIVNLQALDPIEVDFALPEQQTAAVREGLPVRVAVDAWPQERFIGEILAVEPRVDAATRNFSLRARLPNPEGKLRPGQFGRVVVALPGVREVLAVPRTAINYSSYGTSVFLVVPVENPVEGQPALEVSQRFVRIGEALGDYVAVLDGLEAGDEIATSGLLKLRNRQPVILNNEQAPKTELNPRPAQG